MEREKKKWNALWIISMMLNLIIISKTRNYKNAINAMAKTTISSFDERKLKTKAEKWKENANDDKNDDVNDDNVLKCVS